MKIKINSKTTKLLITCLMLLCMGVWRLSTPLQAQEAQEATGSGEITENLKERIEKVVKEKSAEIENTLTELESEKTGFIGQVERVSSEAITILTSKDQRIIAIDEDVELLKGSSNIDIEDISVDDWVLVLGYSDGESLTPKRITVSEDSLRPRDYQVELGAIASIEDDVLTINPRENAASELEFSLTSRTKLEDIEEESITQSDLESQLQALIIYYEEDDENIATRIRVLTTL